jgi:hypothetical protein
MRSFFSCAAVLCAAVSLLVCGCPQQTTNPIAPGADGWISLGAGADPAGKASLEIRFYARNFASAETLLPASCEARDGCQKLSIPLGGVSFPREFHIGPEGVGATNDQDWLVLAWLSGTYGASLPAAGEYFGIAAVALPDCTSRCNVTCYCGRVHDVGVVIDTIAN